VIVVSTSMRIARLLLPRSVRRAIKRRFLNSESPIDLLASPPWCSPNVWEQAVAAYRDKERPRIFEYGSGCSSIHHIRNLLAADGGSYAAAEHDPDWFGKVCGAIVELALHSGCTLVARTHRNFGASLDFEVEIVRREAAKCTVSLRLRPPHGTYAGGEGGPGEFEEYIHAVGGTPHDLIVVDGRARKACVHYILEQRLILPGGTLALFEAGRGSPHWLGEPTTAGDADYQPAVHAMLALSGSLLDGSGYYSWPQFDDELTPARKNPPIPLEACFLTMCEDRR
jgi:hypothetical protein